MRMLKMQINISLFIKATISLQFFLFTKLQHSQLELPKHQKGTHGELTECINIIHDVEKKIKL